MVLLVYSAWEMLHCGYLPFQRMSYLFRNLLACSSKMIHLMTNLARSAGDMRMLISKAWRPEKRAEVGQDHTSIVSKNSLLLTHVSILLFHILNYYLRLGTTPSGVC